MSDASQPPDFGSNSGHLRSTGAFHHAVGRPAPVRQQWLERVAFSKHALERFSERTGLPNHDPDALERLVRDLLAVEGRIRRDRPYWARSRRGAATFLALGEWMLFPLVQDAAFPARLVAVTAICGTQHATWRTAVHAGFIRTRRAHELVHRYLSDLPGPSARPATG